jgi:hypothetical protein
VNPASQNSEAAALEPLDMDDEPLGVEEEPSRTARDRSGPAPRRRAEEVRPGAIVVTWLRA